MNELLPIALRFLKEGISVVPVANDGSKRPAFAWQRFQEELPNTDELLMWFKNGVDGIGVVTGKVSGNLEMLELEGRAVAQKIHLEIAEIANNSGLKELWEQLNSGYVEMTPSGGLHWLYKISDGEVAGNTKLARKPGENGGIDVLAETRGEGGFTITAPSGGTTHPSGGNWTLIGGSIETIPTITMQQRNALHDLFAMFDQMPKIESIQADVVKRDDSFLSAGDDYNAKVTWSSILEPLGWTKVYSKGDATAWRRPGKNEGVSATTNFSGNDKLFVFSTSTIFNAESSYSKFAAYAQIEHNGDFKQAAKALREKGYGASQELKTDWAGLDVHAPSLVQLHDENEEVATSSWIPREIWNEDFDEELPPSMLRREDGNNILYAGKVNALFGESESGKTWVALEAVRQELAKGNCVFYIDFEDSARGIFNRLKTLKCDMEKLKSFKYANPDEPLGDGIGEIMKTEIGKYLPTLIVVDGVNAAMNLLGLDLEKNKDATTFSQKVLKPLKIFGAGILTIDHVTKSKDNRGNYAIGAQAKRADIDGVAIACDVSMPFGRGIDGCLDLKVTKDRPGFVRALCPDAKTLGIANIRNGKDESISVSISGGTVAIASADSRLELVSQFMEAHGYEMGLNEIRDKIRKEGHKIGNTEISTALTSLVMSGNLLMKEEGQKKLFKHKKTFVVNDVRTLETLPVDNS
jgi:hypothetical protein